VAVAHRRSSYRGGIVPFVEVKHPDHGWIRDQLSASEASGIWSNFAPLSLRLESRFAELLELPGDRRVVACANGTIALHALVLLHEHLAGRKLRWVVSAFTFHAQHQGALGDAQVVDCDASGFLDLAALAALPSESYDGVVVTHLFGSARSVAAYESLAAGAGKVLLFDAATCVGSRCAEKPFGRHGDAEVFSFHHTKPCGFGEGGCVVVPAALEGTFRSLVNFGLYQGIDTGARSLNGKMSDVAAAYVLDRLRAVDTIRLTHQREFRRIAAITRRLGLEVLVDPTTAGGLPSLVPVLLPRPVGADRLAGQPLVLHKYYRPLQPRPRASGLYARVVCLPCHAGVAAATDEVITAMLSGLAT
jgi:dTDP-4-amino-4,6-dideoxygalactose transaminase